jgi:GNAT superfamily N-acetyltransferase
MEFAIREATLEDVPVLIQVIEESARAIEAEDYTPAQIEAALGSAWGVDSNLIRDRTYFVVEEAGQVVACGGWSFRNALFGADALTGKQPEPLDPIQDPARIRAFFVRPGWARRGIGTMLLERCEEAAKRAGFRSLTLVATLPGRRLYEAYGFSVGETIEHPLSNGETISFLTMSKIL